MADFISASAVACRATDFLTLHPGLCFCRGHCQVCKSNVLSLSWDDDPMAMRALPT